MAATGTPTPNIGLRIPQGTDPASVDDINYNSNLLDTKLGAVGNTSVQNQIDSLNSKIASFANSAMIDSLSKTTHSFTVPNSDRHLLFGLGASANNSFGAIVACASNGAVTFVELGKGSNVTLSSGTNTFTVTLSNGGGLKIIDFMSGSTPLNVS